MRSALVLVAVLGCGPGIPGSAPPAKQPATSIELAAVAPQLPPGERLAFTVYWSDVAVGRAELANDVDRVHSSFRTTELASALVDLRFDLVSQLAHGWPRSLVETVVTGGKAEHVRASLARGSYQLANAPVQLAPEDGPVHSLHTALGIVRAWSRRHDKGSGHLWLLHRGKLFRLDVFGPVRDAVAGKPALRVDAVARAIDRSREVALSIWLGAGDARLPLQITARSEGELMTAELAAP
ncbi:MAG: DUF3108 domain-containing protein [Kofleriaceae bacterium]